MLCMGVFLTVSAECDLWGSYAGDCGMYAGDRTRYSGECVRGSGGLYAGGCGLKSSCVLMGLK